MKHFLLLIAGFAFTGKVFSQNGTTYFTTAIKANISFKTTRSTLLNDGNFIITGQKGDDIDQYKQTKVIFKTDGEGNIIWQHSFNAAKNMGEAVTGIAPSGGFLITAPTIKNNNIETIVFKTDANGAITNTQLLSDSSTQAEISDILPSNDKKLIFIGMAKGNFPNVDNATDIYITKQDETFNVLWSKIYSLSDKEFYSTSTLLKDGTILTGGIASSCGQGCISKAYIMAVNPDDGTHIKTKMFNVTSYTVNNLIPAADGGFYTIINDQGKETYNILKFNNKVELVFAKEYVSQPKLQLVNVMELTNGKLLVAGYSDTGFSILKLDNKGDVLEAKNYFSRFSFSKINLFAKNDNTITAVVNDYNQTTVFNFDNNGNTGCIDSIRAFEVTAVNLDVDFYTNTSPVFYNKPNMDKGPVFKNYTFTNEPATDLTISSKLICKTTASAIKEKALDAFGVSFYPNPASGLLTVTVSEVKTGSELLIHNMYGQLIYSSKLNGRQAVIDLTPYAKGVYFATVRNGMEVVTNKIVLQ